MTERTMRAAWYEEKGKAREVIKFGVLPIPKPSEGEVLVKVHVSGVNPSDTKTRGGWGGSFSMPFPKIVPHNDGAGIIEAVGEGVDSQRIGERVWLYETQEGRAFGSAAEYTVVPSHQAIELPENASFAQGACLGVPAMTAHRAVFADGSVKGKTLLVTGGAGAVGNYAIQLAKWGGATVFTTVSRPEQAKVAQAAGADEIINYKTEDVVARIKEITGEERSVDRVIDVNFKANSAVVSAVIRPNSTIVCYASPNSDDRPALPFFNLLFINTTLRLILVYTMPETAKQQAAQDIVKALSTGALKENIARCFSLEELVEAHEIQDSGELIGQAIIKII